MGMQQPAHKWRATPPEDKYKERHPLRYDKIPVDKSDAVEQYKSRSRFDSDSAENAEAPK